MCLVGVEGVRGAWEKVELSASFGQVVEINGLPMKRALPNMRCIHATGLVNCCETSHSPINVNGFERSGVYDLLKKSSFPKSSLVARVMQVSLPHTTTSAFVEIYIGKLLIVYRYRCIGMC